MLICPVREGEDNESLRYAMRSWEANLHPKSSLHLMIVGYKPSWCEPDQWRQGNYHESTMANVWDNIRIGCEAAVKGWDEVVIMNDDFFCMDPTETIPEVMRDISLVQHCSLARGSGGWWESSLDLTAYWLSEQGYPQPTSYEVHRPFPCAPEAMLSVMEEWGGDLSGVVPQWRTLYGTLQQVNGYPVRDSKMGAPGANTMAAWVSTTPDSWNIYSSIMTERFQKPSRWER